MGNLNTQSKTYTKQSRFEGSSRQVRSAIVRHLLASASSCSYSNIRTNIRIDLGREINKDQLRVILDQLAAEGMIAINDNGRYTIT